MWIMMIVLWTACWRGSLWLLMHRIKTNKERGAARFSQLRSRFVWYLPPVFIVLLSSYRCVLERSKLGESHAEHWTYRYTYLQDCTLGVTTLHIFADLSQASSIWFSFLKWKHLECVINEKWDLYMTLSVTGCKLITTSQQTFCLSACGCSLVFQCEPTALMSPSDKDRPVLHAHLFYSVYQSSAVHADSSCFGPSINLRFSFCNDLCLLSVSCFILEFLLSLSSLFLPPVPVQSPSLNSFVCFSLSLQCAVTC